MNLVEYLKNDLGLEAYKDGYLRRRINSRMIRRGITSEEEYLEILKKDKKELEALKDALSINVTSFFRNPEVWKKLRDLLEETDEKYLKAWSAACSDGREAYSLAIICDEIGKDVEIIATDIDEDALFRARQAVYSNISEEISFLSDVHRYFIIDNGKSIIKPEIKRKVKFLKHDIIKEKPPSKNFNLVFCRNFLIYIESEHKPVVSRHIADSMKKGGIPVLGKTETLPIEGFFEAIDRTNKIYRRV
ncbi:MAG TPA: protein-glutamate O-methyltransferase CheR [Archaeoglobaceae archaeon]|nr:protein-glutamate O-methyltransferase CheR [Archaeoglobaceae archaeon]